MKRIFFSIALFTLFFSCSEDEVTAVPETEEEEERREPGTFSVIAHDATFTATFGDLPYRVSYPAEKQGETFVLIVSRGGNGAGDDRGQLVSYINHFVEQGYVVVQVDHRNAGNDIENIAKLRGAEINELSKAIEEGTLDYGGFQGEITGSKQGYMGHSAGAMEGLLASGMNTDHGNYRASAVKAVYAMSPPGYTPDQYGIAQSPNGYTAIGETAVFMIIGEQEKDTNGSGTINAENWRLQGYDQMNESGLRYQVLVKGDNTDHEAIAGLNEAVKFYNEANSLALFDTFVRGLDRKAEIGTLNQPMTNELEIKVKGNQ